MEILCHVQSLINHIRKMVEHFLHLASTGFLLIHTWLTQINTYSFFLHIDGSTHTLTHHQNILQNSCRNSHPHIHHIQTGLLPSMVHHPEYSKNLTISRTLLLACSFTHRSLSSRTSTSSLSLSKSTSNFSSWSTPSTGILRAAPSGQLTLIPPPPPPLLYLTC